MAKGGEMSEWGREFESLADTLPDLHRSTLFRKLVRSVSDAFRARRKALGFSQRDAAEALGVHVSTWGQLERRYGVWQLTTLFRMARALDCEIEIKLVARD